MKWPQERSQDALDGLLTLARVAVRSPSGERVPAVVVELMDALAADAASTPGSDAVSSETMGFMSEGVTPNQAGALVGLSGRQVRALCASGLVRSGRDRSGYVVDVVDVDDLHRYLGERAS